MRTPLMRRVPAPKERRKPKGYGVRVRMDELERFFCTASDSECRDSSREEPHKARTRE